MNFRFELSENWYKDSESHEQVRRLVIKNDTSKHVYFITNQEFLVLQEILKT